MSLNDLFKEKSKTKTAVLVALIAEVANSMENSSTEKTKIAIESFFLKKMERAERKELEYGKISTRSKLDEGSYTSYKNMLRYDIIANNAIISSVLEEYISTVNQIAEAALEIENKIKKIKQKKAVLEGWDSISEKFLIKERFLYLDNINFQNSKGKNLSISNEGEVTLPIISKTEVPIKTISIKNGNGNPGNSDNKVSLNNMNLKNVLDGDPDSWFEYERLDSGPVNLRLKILLENPEIINEIMIESFCEGSDKIRIKNINVLSEDHSILVEIQNGRNGAILSGTSPTFRKQFKPGLAKYVMINLSSNSYERIANFRKRFKIAIRNIKLIRNSYEKSGSLYSEDYDIIEDLNLVRCQIQGSGLNDVFSNVNVEYSFDDGEEWKSKEGEKVVPIGSKKIEWKLMIDRDDESFKVFDSFEKTVPNYSYIQKTFSKNKGIRKIIENGRGNKKGIFGLEKGFVSKSKRKYTKLASLKNFKSLKSDDTFKNESEYQVIDLPFDIYDVGIQEDEIKIKINNIEYQLVENLDEVINQDYSFCVMDSQREIALNGSLPRVSTVKWKIDPEELRVEEDSRYYYFKFKNYFNPDKDCISLVQIGDERKVKKEKLNPLRSVFKLKEDFIFEDSVTVKDEDGNELALIDNSSDLDSTTFFFDEESRVLKVKDQRNKKQLYVSYEYESKYVIDEKDYELWFEDNDLRGIKVKKEKINAKSYKEKISKKRKKFQAGRGRSKVASSSYNNSKRFEIQAKGIVGNSIRILNKDKVKEVQYIDGESEFNEIFLIENEETNSFEKPVATNIVSFKVAAGDKIIERTGISFEENEYFVQEVSVLNSEGDWRVSGDGTVSVYASNGIPEGIKYSYYYSGGKKLKNRFSYDEDNNFLYFSEDQIASEVEIEYKVLDVSAEYDMCKKIDLIESESKSYSVNTDLLYNTVADLRIFFVDKKEDGKLTDLKEYYSPIIESLNFRFK